VVDNSLPELQSAIRDDYRHPVELVRTELIVPTEGIGIRVDLKTDLVIFLQDVVGERIVDQIRKGIGLDARHL
jgi:hypothetical protein